MEDDFVAAVRDPRVDVAVTVKLHGECYKCGSVDEETGEPIFWRRRDLKLSKVSACIRMCACVHVCMCACVCVCVRARASEVVGVAFADVIDLRFV